MSGFGYFLEQAKRPQTIGYALLDSPVALAAWILDHDTDSYYKISRAFVDGRPSGNLTRDHILDNITLYWLTGTGASAARSYWEGGRAASAAAAAGKAPPGVSIPVGYTTFPGEIFRAPGVGSSTPTPTSSTSTRSTRLATSPPGKSPSCSRARSVQRFDHSGKSGAKHGRPPQPKAHRSIELDKRDDRARAQAPVPRDGLDARLAVAAVWSLRSRSAISDEANKVPVIDGGPGSRPDGYVPGLIVGGD
jgi:hypothetical protein